MTLYFGCHNAQLKRDNDLKQTVYSALNTLVSMWLLQRKITKQVTSNVIIWSNLHIGAFLQRNDNLDPVFNPDPALTSFNPGLSLFFENKDEESARTTKESDNLFFGSAVNQK